MIIMKRGIGLFLLAASIIFAVTNCSKEGDEKKEAIDLKVTTNAVADLTAFTATGGGEITGTEPIIKRGICWSTNAEPTTDDKVVIDVDPVVGDFILKMSDLEPGTSYNVRAFAVTHAGETVYGNTVNFSTKTVTPQVESNSYIVGYNDVVVIPVSRANKSALGELIASGDEITAELIWMDNEDVIEEVFTYGKGGTGNIVVATGSINGNAVVAVRVNNNIVWSWHIWVDAEPSKIGTIRMPSGAVLMDRNLGATSKAVSEIGAVGIQFQFGRKDPFTASASFGTPSEVLLYDLSGRNPEIKTVDGPKDLAFAVANPHTYIKSLWVDWCDENITTWWQSEDGSKTVYDPCPAGWRVPALEDYSGLADEHFNKNVEGGHNFIFDGQSNFFAFTGYREVEGNMDATANYGTFWVNSVISGDAGIGSALSPSFGVGGTAPINGAPKARALSIRCIKE
ncbi:hypothetical protein PSM36_2470 [Proteiniphilum saccharofermentans]|uniref:Fibrobacter succinogenes major paralogous domain-containing protein n=2 Tax=Proteiniphilum saccharofermentans TaxID=1642647 RepID=A0A1R3SYK6_9BACT|nr:hypothetical protein PSM36_2470 [Proteiniphilum saccharofermentans]